MTSSSMIRTKIAKKMELKLSIQQQTTRNSSPENRKIIRAFISKWIISLDYQRKWK
jgi:hypothetical protein